MGVEENTDLHQWAHRGWCGRGALMQEGGPWCGRRGPGVSWGEGALVQEGVALVREGGPAERPLGSADPS